MCGACGRTGGDWSSPFSSGAYRRRQIAIFLQGRAGPRISITPFGYGWIVSTASGIPRQCNTVSDIWKVPGLSGIVAEATIEEAAKTAVAAAAGKRVVSVQVHARDIFPQKTAVKLCTALQDQGAAFPFFVALLAGLLEKKRRAGVAEISGLPVAVRIPGEIIGEQDTPRYLLVDSRQNVHICSGATLNAA